MQAKGILVAMATMFMTTECFLPFGLPQELRRSSEDSEFDCLERAIQCFGLWINSEFQSESSFGFINITEINELCTDFQQASDCMRLLDPCANAHQGFVDQNMAAGDFMCSQRGRSLLEESQSSPCFSNSSLLDDVSEATSQCIHARLDTVPDDPCEDTVIRVECTVTAAEDQCGESTGQYVRELSAAMIQAGSGPQCSLSLACE